MALLSDILRGDRRLEACLTDDSAHLVEGTVGSHVSKVQLALLVVDGLAITANEEHSQRYGPSTAAAVLAFKTKRQIINRGYQTRPDNIVGKMTIAALDRELLQKQRGPKSSKATYCGNDHETAGRVAVERSFVYPVTLTSASAAATTTGPSSAPLPSEVAKARAPGAIVAVNTSRSTLSRLIIFHRHPVLPIPPGLGEEWDALWANFGLPKFPAKSPLPDGAPVNDVATFLSVVDAVLAGMASNLSQASTLFREPLSPWYSTAHAFTLRGKRDTKDPPNWPDGMYFNPRYLTTPGGDKVGPKKQTEVIVHECAHFVNNDDIQDPTKQVLTSCYGYSGYVLHCAFNQSDIFDDTE